MGEKFIKNFNLAQDNEIYTSSSIRMTPKYMFDFLRKGDVLFVFTVIKDPDCLELRHNIDKKEKTTKRC